jgi:signal transduction histidine kinase
MPEHATLVDRLAEHRTLGQAPRAELEWLAAHGEVRLIKSGDVITKANHPVTQLYVPLSGRFAISVDRGYGPRKVMEWSGGDVGGLLPYSRMAKAPGEAVVSEPGEVLLVDKENFPELIRTCPWITAALVHVMVDRARVFTSSGLQDEKMMSLGRLAAGLAHELNNPASAAARSAARLEEGLERAESTSRALGAALLTPEQQAVIDGVRRGCLDGDAPILSAMERADREETLVSWLEARRLDPEPASALMGAGVSTKTLDILANALPPASVGTAIDLIAANCTIHSLAGEVQRASSRIHHLVAAVKRFTYMDKPGVPEPVDVEQGLRDTVIVLGSKAREKRVDVSLDIEANLPGIRGFGGELNQVWSNLIDNALDAAPIAGHVAVKACSGVPHSVIVKITDDGPGVPEEIRGKIFDPFFTTKAVGQGTGLGLDIAQKLVRHNGGEIELKSQPGHTEFRVILPAM